MLICVTVFYIFRQMVADAEAEAVLWEQTSEAIAAPPALLEAPE
jgi:hypothetical protein